MPTLYSPGSTPGPPMLDNSYFPSLSVSAVPTAGPAGGRNVTTTVVRDLPLIVTTPLTGTSALGLAAARRSSSGSAGAQPTTPSSIRARNHRRRQTLLGDTIASSPSGSEDTGLLEAFARLPRARISRSSSRELQAVIIRWRFGPVSIHSLAVRAGIMQPMDGTRPTRADCAAPTGLRLLGRRGRGR